MVQKKQIVQFVVQNRTDCGFDVPIFEFNVFSINATTKYSWDVTYADFSCLQALITINGITYTVDFDGTLYDLLVKLNALKYGFFCSETIGGLTFIYTYDDTNVYGDLEVCLAITTTTTTAIPTTTTTTSTSTTSTSTTSTTTTAIPTTTTSTTSTSTTSTTTTAIPTTTTTTTSTSTTSTSTTDIPTTTTTTTSTTTTSTTDIPTTTTTTSTSTTSTTSTSTTSTSTTSTTTTAIVGDCYTIENTDAVDISASYTDIYGNPACQAVPVVTTVYICVKSGTGGSIVLYLGTGCLSGSGSGIITSLGSICTTSGDCIPTTTTTTTTSTTTSTTTNIVVVDCSLTDSSFGTSAIFNLGTISGNVTITGSGLTSGDTYNIIYPVGGSIIHTTTAVDGVGNLDDTFFWTYDSVNTNAEIILFAP